MLEFRLYISPIPKIVVFQFFEHQHGFGTGASPLPVDDSKHILDGCARGHCCRWVCPKIIAYIYYMLEYRLYISSIPKVIVYIYYMLEYRLYISLIPNIIVYIYYMLEYRLYISSIPKISVYTSIPKIPNIIVCIIVT